MCRREGNYTFRLLSVISLRNPSQGDIGLKRSGGQKRENPQGRTLEGIKDVYNIFLETPPLQLTPKNNKEQVRKINGS